MKYITIFFATITITLSGCRKKIEESSEVLRPVRYETVQKQGAADQKVFTGIATPGITSRLSFRVPGTISRLHVNIGQQVKRGDLISMLDDSDYELQYEEADAGVKNADAQEKSAKSNYERISLLYENQNISLAEYESARAAMESSKAQEKALKQRRKLAKSQLSYTRLYSPLDGVIAEVLVEENENVGGGQPVVVINSDESMEVEVTVPDIYISDIKTGERVSVRFSAVEGKSFEGMVSEVGFAAGYQTTYPVIVQLSSDDPAIRPGMSAEVEIPLGVKDTVQHIHVPLPAVMEDQGGRFVFLVSPEEQGTGIVEKRSVEIGHMDAGGIEIISGLEEGEHVITAGMSKMKDGLRVRLSN